MEINGVRFILAHKKMNLTPYFSDRLNQALAEPVNTST
jgi:hypothetical protein